MRDLFHVPETYFLSHSVGCLPKAAEAGLEQQVMAPWREGRNWADWMGILERFRANVAWLINVTASGICPQVNISSALTKIVFSLPVVEGRNAIVLSAQDFPTIGFVLKQAERAGYVLRFVEGDVTDVSRWEDAMGDDVAIVQVTHALSNTSHVLPVGEICTLARSNGAISIVDIAQSAGVLPVDVSVWRPDFLIGTSVKFLCGGPGACFMYASQKMLEACAPVDVGWFSHADPFEMDIHDFRYAEDAMRFFGGTPSPGPLALANTALDIWRDEGLERVCDAVNTSLDFLVEQVADEALVSPEAGTRGAALVVRSQDAERLQSALEAAGILHDQRREGFRFSVHGYTSEQDVERLAAVLKHAC